ncbi:hypothetical protein CTA1_3416 [Colletotrichum tanaceti]|uniref:Uncharacterized protein n=1 Tax=Colletotrichum tanaceti TaxID=1306861 RepID=A0A4U6XFT7_9PEZI|nr:hypothetical protein CTA1_3416 [Colletotrichum tanaceti]
MADAKTRPYEAADEPHHGPGASKSDPSPGPPVLLHVTRSPAYETNEHPAPSSF